MVVTGGLGFIGSNFILKIKKRFPSWKIVNVDAEFMGSNKQNLEEITEWRNYKYVKGNITNKRLIESQISSADVVVNFAAESHVDRSINDPKPFIMSNIVGVYTILDSVRKSNTKFIQISTDEVFGSLTKQSANEDFKLNPSSPYASSKASAELLVQSYITTYNCDAIITRCTNNFGPRQSLEKLIPKTIVLALNNHKIPVFGTGNNIRDWIFVEDHCDAIIEIMLRGKTGSSYNISGGNELDNLTIIKRVLELLQKPKELIRFTKDRPGHDFRYSLNSKKIRSELRWKPHRKFDSALKETIDWYIENKKWWSKINLNELLNTNWKTR